MSKELDQVAQSLKDNGNFGSASNVVFDGYSVKAATADQLKAAKRTQDVAAGGVEEADEPNLQQLVQEQQAADAKKK